MSVLSVNKNNFESVKSSDKPVLLDFYADWCGPCRMVSPLVDEIAEENPQYLVGKINVDEQPELAQAFGVASIPTLVVMNFLSRFLSRIFMPPLETSTSPSFAKYFSILDTTSRAELI